MLMVRRVSYLPSGLGVGVQPPPRYLMPTSDACVGFESALATCAGVRYQDHSFGTEGRLSLFCHDVSGEGVVVAVVLPIFHIVSDLVCAHKKKASIRCPLEQTGTEAFIS